MQYGAVFQIGIGPRSTTNSMFIRERFVPHVPVNVLFVTEDVPPDATHMTVVIGIEGFKTTPVVRDMPITK